MPRLLAPCQPSSVKVPPAGPDWLHEIKHDGFRLMVWRDGGRVRTKPLAARVGRAARSVGAAVAGPWCSRIYFDGGPDHRVIVQHLVRLNLFHDEQDSGDLVVMRRREFITLLGGTVVTPLKARAQQAVPVIGYFDWGRNSVLLDAFRQGLADAGYVEGRNVAIIYRSAEGQDNRLRPLAADLVGRRVSVILANGALATALAAKALTPTIPIVIASGGDPVKYGLVASLNRPGGNVTGMTWISAELVGKRLGLLHEMAPQATTVAFLSDGPDLRMSEADAVAAANALKLQIIVMEARNESDIDAAFASLVQRGAGALVVGFAPHVTFYYRKIVGLAARNKIPAIYPVRFYARIGGLMSYGTDPADNLRQVAVDYVARILKGANPADLPIAQPTKFPLVIKLKTAKRLGLEVPNTLLIQADEVIE